MSYYVVQYAGSVNSVNFTLYSIYILSLVTPHPFQYCDLVLHNYIVVRNVQSGLDYHEITVSDMWDVSITYNWKVWQGIYFGGTAIWRATCQYFIHQTTAG